MIYISILAKAYAFLMVSAHPVLATLFWGGGLVLDVLELRKRAGGEVTSKVLRDVALVNLSVIVLGAAVGDACDYAAMRWKDGIPVLSHAAGSVLRTLGIPAGTHLGEIYLTTMAGPLEFDVSLDNLGVWTPALVLVFSLVVRLWTASTLRSALLRTAGVAGILIAVAVVRLVFATVVFLALTDFVGYESEELPVAPFWSREAISWSYLPILLLCQPLVARMLCHRAEGQTDSGASREVPVLLRWAGIPVLVILSIAMLWEPVGQKKTGEVLIDTFHTQWSRTDRPYDREWYGADSGYNYACLKRLYGKFYPVRELKSRIRAEDLESASVLIIYDPDRAFSDDERRLVQQFVRDGGGLFLIGDHTNVFGSTSHLNDLCEPFGFQFRDDVLFDIDEDFHQLLDISGLPSQFVQGTSFFKFRGPASIRQTAFSTRSVFEIDHSKALRAIYSVNNFYPPPHDHPKMETGKFCVSAASRFGRGRVLAFADSTVFSNFEIFYPGKYEYLLNGARWLNHEDGLIGSLVRRLCFVAVLVGCVGFVVWYRRPRVWLAAAVVSCGAYFVASNVSLAVEAKRAEFPEPVRQLRTLFFVASADDPVFHLRDPATDTPYNQKYDVFTQWVLRTGAFSGFYLTGAEYRNGLYEHLSAGVPEVESAVALIVRGPEQYGLLDLFAEGQPLAGSRRLLLMFASEIAWEQVSELLEATGIVTGAGLIEEAAAAWPEGEVVLETAGRRVVLVSAAERFSDEAMGFSEKVVPTEAQRARFEEAFRLIDQVYQAGEVETE